MNKLISILFLVALSAQAATNVVPRANNYGDLGTSSKRWRTVYGTTGDFSAIKLDGTLLSTNGGSGSTEYVAAGSNVTVATNGSTYTVSVAAPGTTEYLVPGANVSIQTNGNTYTINASGAGGGGNAFTNAPGQYFAGTNTFDTINVQSNLTLNGSLTVSNLSASAIYGNGTGLSNTVPAIGTGLQYDQGTTYRLITREGTTLYETPDISSDGQTWAFSAISATSLALSPLEIGTSADATGTSAVSIGDTSLAAGDYSVALGHGSDVTAGGDYAVGVGQHAAAYEYGGVALGASTVASAYQSVALGYGAENYAWMGLALGPSTYVFPAASNSVAIGYGTQVQYSNSVGVLGNPTAASQIMLGSTGHTVSIPGAVSISGGSSNYLGGTTVATNLTATGTFTGNGNGLTNFTQAAITNALGYDPLSLSQLALTYYFWGSSNHPSIGTYLSMERSTATPTAQNTNAYANPTYGTYPAVFASRTAAQLTTIHSGTLVVTFRAYLTGGGSLSITPEVYVRTSGGTETEIATGAAISLDTTPITRIQPIALGTNVTVNTTDFIVVKFKTSGKTGTPTVQFVSGGQTGCGLEVPVPSSQFALTSSLGTAASSNATAFVLAPTNSGTLGQVVSLTGDSTKWVDMSASSSSPLVPWPAVEYNNLSRSMDDEQWYSLFANSYSSFSRSRTNGAVWLNPSGDAPTLGFMCYPFRCPPTTTNVTFSVTASCPSGTKSMNLAIYRDFATSTTMTNNIFTVTTTPTTYSIVATGCTNNVYNASIWVNGGGVSQGSIIVWSNSITVNSNTPSPIPYYRHMVTPEVLQDNNEYSARAVTPYAVNVGYRATSHSWFEATTTSTNIWVEITDKELYNTSELSLVVLTNGVVCTNFVSRASDAPYKTNQLYLGQITLYPGTKTIRFINSQNSRGSFGADWGGMTVRSVFSDAPFYQLPKLNGKKVSVWGDSIMGGGGASIPGETSAIALLRRMGYAVTDNAIGWDRLFDWTNQLDRVVRTLTLSDPELIWINMGLNDYGGPGLVASDFQVWYAELINRIQAKSQAFIIAQSPIRRGTETANANGDTLLAFRAAVSNAAAIYPSRCMYVEGTNILTALSGDNIHPNDIGFAQMANVMGQIIMTNQVISSERRSSIIPASTIAKSTGHYTWNFTGVDTLLLNGDRNVTLPLARTNYGRRFTVVCTTAGTNLISCVTGDAIDSITTATNLSIGSSKTFVSDGNTNWWSIAK